MAIRIITDSTSDVLPQEAIELGIDVVPLKSVFRDTVYRENIDITHKEFYEKLATVKTLPTTSQPAPADFLPLFEDAKKAGDDVVCLLLSSVLSGTVQSAQIAKGMCEYENIYIVDTLTTTVGIRTLLTFALQMHSAGLPAKEIAEKLEDAKTRIVLYAMVDTLEYLHKGGRLSTASKVLGGILNVKPIITIDEGAIKVVDKARGVEKAMDAMLELIGAVADEEPNLPVFYGYTANDEQGTTFMQKADAYYGFTNSAIHSVGSVVGTHAGPSAFVICYIKKKA